MLRKVNICHNFVVWELIRTFVAQITNWNRTYVIWNEVRLLDMAEHAGHPAEHGGAHRGGHRAGIARAADGVALQAVHRRHHPDGHP